MESKELTIVVVTFKSDEVIHSCLQSIPRDIKVIVVENSNSNQFKQKIEKNILMLIVYLQVKTKVIQSAIILDWKK